MYNVAKGTVEENKKLNLSKGNPILIFKVELYFEIMFAIICQMSLSSNYILFLNYFKFTRITLLYNIRKCSTFDSLFTFEDIVTGIETRHVYPSYFETHSSALDIYNFSLVTFEDIVTGIETRRVSRPIRIRPLLRIHLSAWTDIIFTMKETF
jgi:hypothetical protein